MFPWHNVLLFVSFKFTHKSNQCQWCYWWCQLIVEKKHVFLHRNAETKSFSDVIYKGLKCHMKSPIWVQCETSTPFFLFLCSDNHHVCLFSVFNFVATQYKQLVLITDIQTDPSGHITVYFGFLVSLTIQNTHSGQVEILNAKKFLTCENSDNVWNWIYHLICLPCPIKWESTYMKSYSIILCINALVTVVESVIPRFASLGFLRIIIYGSSVSLMFLMPWAHANHIPLYPSHVLTVLSICVS